MPAAAALFRPTGSTPRPRKRAGARRDADTLALRERARLSVDLRSGALRPALLLPHRRRTLPSGCRPELARERRFRPVTGMAPETMCLSALSPCRADRGGVAPASCLD